MISASYVPAVLAPLLALLVVWEVLPAHQPAPPAAPLTRPAVVAADDVGDEAATWTALILARPLFRGDRRPLAALPDSVDLTLPRLSAIVITAAGRSAIFINADGSSSVLTAGGHSGAYQLQAITPDSVHLAGPNGPVTLHPQFADAAGAAPPPGATAAAGHFQDNQQ